MSLVEFENGLLVLLQWGWNYVTRNRSARLITETPKSREKHPWPTQPVRNELPEIPASRPDASPRGKRF